MASRPRFLGEADPGVDHTEEVITLSPKWHDYVSQNAGTLRLGQDIDTTVFGFYDPQLDAFEVVERRRTWEMLEGGELDVTAELERRHPGAYVFQQNIPRASHSALGAQSQ